MATVTAPVASTAPDLFVAPQPVVAAESSAPARLSADEISTLIEQALPQVESIVAGVAARYPRHADRDELAQAAALGLVEAAHRYDPSRGVPFDAWAALRIRGAIVDAARALDFAPRSLRASARQLETAANELLQQLGRTPSEAELAAHLAVDVRELAQLRGKVHRALVLSLDAPCGEDDGDALTLADNLVEADDTDPSEQLEAREQAAYLRDALELLPERLRTVVVGYFLEGRSSGELAEQLSVTESRVSQLRSEGLALLRAGIAAQFDMAVTIPGTSASPRAARRQADYAATLATRSSFASRVGTRHPVRTTPVAA